MVCENFLAGFDKGVSASSGPTASVPTRNKIPVELATEAHGFDIRGVNPGSFYMVARDRRLAGGKSVPRESAGATVSTFEARKQTHLELRRDCVWLNSAHRNDRPESRTRRRRDPGDRE